MTDDKRDDNSFLMVAFGPGPAEGTWVTGPEFDLYDPDGEYIEIPIERAYGPYIVEVSGIVGHEYVVIRYCDGHEISRRSIPLSELRA